MRFGSTQHHVHSPALPSPWVTKVRDRAEWGERMAWRGEERCISASGTLCPEGGGRGVVRVAETERSEAAPMSSKQEGAGDKGRWGGTEGWRCAPAVGSAMKKTEDK